MNWVGARNGAKRRSTFRLPASAFLPFPLPWKIRCWLRATLTCPGCQMKRADLTERKYAETRNAYCTPLVSSHSRTTIDLSSLRGWGRQRRISQEVAHPILYSCTRHPGGGLIGGSELTRNIAQLQGPNFSPEQMGTDRTMPVSAAAIAQRAASIFN
jgi:hypothetical protein